MGALKKYKLTLLALKPGKTAMTITFKNEDTHEYIFYRVVRLSPIFSFLLTSQEPEHRRC